MSEGEEEKNLSKSNQRTRERRPRGRDCRGGELPSEESSEKCINPERVATSGPKVLPVLFTSVRRNEPDRALDTINEAGCNFHKWWRCSVGIFGTGHFLKRSLLGEGWQ